MEEIQETGEFWAGTLRTMEQNNRWENHGEETVNHYWTKTIKIAKEALK
jgi:hypothetical protein